MSFLKKNNVLSEEEQCPFLKKNNRFSKQIDHAFRKRFNIVLKLNNDINVNIAEKLMGHSVKIQLDNSYLPISDPRVTEEMFKEFKKAIPELTVDGFTATEVPDILNNDCD